MYEFPVAVARFSFDGNAKRSTSGFVDYVMFSHNSANWPDSATTCVFRPVRQVAAPGAKSAVFDRILFAFADVKYLVFV